MSVSKAAQAARDQLFSAANGGWLFPGDFSAFGAVEKPNAAQIRAWLSASAARDKIQGMRAVLALVAEGSAEAPSFFADVVKLVFERHAEVREMAAAYLIMHAEHEPELTLMVVNAIQRMLGESSVLARLQSLRLAAALRVPTVVPIVMHLLGTASRDPSPLVRAACCQAAGTVYTVDPSVGDEVLELLAGMLAQPRQQQGDYAVAGWALATVARYLPQRLAWLHPFFRTYVPHLASFDEWCQPDVCRMLVRYCRHFLPSPQDPDAQLLVRSVQPLLFSQNTAVVIESVAVLLYCGDAASESGATSDSGATSESGANSTENENGAPETNILVDAVDRLVYLEKSALVWSSVAAVAAAHPHLFTEHRATLVAEIATYTGDTARRLHALAAVRQCRAEELSSGELVHLQQCALRWQADREAVEAVMRTLVELVGPATATRAREWLLLVASSTASSPELVSAALMALRVQLQQQSQHIDDLPGLLGTIAALVPEPAETETASSEDATADADLLPAAKSTIIWLLGVYATDAPAAAADLLRRVLVTFADEAADVRRQALQLAAKLATAQRNEPAAFDPRVPAMFDYALTLARYDTNIDVRDRARFFAALSQQPDNTLATLLLQADKPVPLAESAAESRAPAFLLDTLSGYFGERRDGYVDLAPWGTAADDTTALRAAPLRWAESSESSESSDESSSDDAAEAEAAPVPMQAPPAVRAKPARPFAAQVSAKVKEMSLEEFLGPAAPPQSESESDESDESSEEEPESPNTEA